MVNTRSGLSNSGWLVFQKPNSQAGIRLFCFPYAGGGALVFRTWPEGLPSNVELCSVQPPGRGTRIRENPFTRLTPLVEATTQALLPYLNKPFAFFGHSMGALLSFEVTRQLRREFGLYPATLFISGHHAPQIPDPNPPLHSLPEAEFMKELHSLNGTPRAVLEDPEVMRLLAPVLRADFAVSETYIYRAEPPLECPIVAFGGLQDDRLSRAHLDAWREQTIASFSLRMLPGDHFFLHASQPLLLQILSRELRRFVSTARRD